VLLEGPAGKLGECVLPEIPWAKITVHCRAGLSTSPRTRLDQLRTWPWSPCPEGHGPIKVWKAAGHSGPCTSGLTAQGPAEGPGTISRWPGEARSLLQHRNRSQSRRAWWERAKVQRAARAQDLLQARGQAAFAVSVNAHRLAVRRYSESLKKHARNKCWRLWIA